MKVFRVVIMCIFLASCSLSPATSPIEKVLPQGPKVEIVTDWTYFTPKTGGTVVMVRFIRINGRDCLETRYGHGGSICHVPPY